jgi:hypothetical protein
MRSRTTITLFGLIIGAALSAESSAVLAVEQAVGRSGARSSAARFPSLRFTVHGSRFTVHGSRFAVRRSRFAWFTVHDLCANGKPQTKPRTANCELRTANYFGGGTLCFTVSNVNVT